jgi:hypothetical protein
MVKTRASRVIPALFTRTSTWPHFFTAASNILRTTHTQVGPPPVE